MAQSGHSRASFEVQELLGSVEGGGRPLKALAAKYGNALRQPGRLREVLPPFPSLKKPCSPLGDGPTIWYELREIQALSLARAVFHYLLLSNNTEVNVWLILMTHLTSVTE